MRWGCAVYHASSVSQHRHLQLNFNLGPFVTRLSLFRPFNPDVFSRSTGLNKAGRLTLVHVPAHPPG